MTYEMNPTTLSAVLNTTADWEPMMEAARQRIKHQQRTTSERPLPVHAAPRKYRIIPSTCKHLEPIPFYQHAFCNRTRVTTFTTAEKCRNCRFYCPKTD